MEYTVTGLLASWKGKEVAVTTVNQEHLIGTLEDVGKSFFILAHNNAPLLINLTGLVSMKLHGPATEYNPRTGETTKR